MNTAISGKEGLEDFLELFNNINSCADGELGFIVGYASENSGNPFADINEGHISSAIHQIVEIMNDSELANAIEEFGAVVERFNQEDKLDAIHNSGAYKQFCKIFDEQGVGLIENYLTYIKEAGMPKEMSEWDDGKEMLDLYNKFVDKYNVKV